MLTLNGISILQMQNFFRVSDNGRNVMLIGAGTRVQNRMKVLNTTELRMANNFFPSLFSPRSHNILLA